MRRCGRLQQGVSLIEAVAGILVGMPLVVLIIFVGVEICSYFVIQSNLDAATRKAARAMAAAWGKDPSVAIDASAQQAVYAQCCIPGFVNDPSQFAAPVFNGTDPATVVVVGTYTSGQFGLPLYPAPNPLHLGSDFVIRSEACYQLE